MAAETKLILGDCITVMKSMADGSVDTIITSPPYNKHSAKRKCGGTDTWQKVNISYGEFKDDLLEEEYQEQQKQFLKECIRIIKPLGSVFYNHKVRVINHKTIIPSDWMTELNIRQILIWDRGSSLQLAPIRWFPTTEYIYWITKTNCQPKFYKRSKYQMEVIRISPKPMKEHPAPYPIELVKIFIENTTDKNDTILDPYLGSGTTGVAARELGRNFIGIEIHKPYLDIAEQRIKNTTEELF